MVAKEIFVNLPVNDLEKSKAFFISLGFSFNPQFTNQDAGCLILGENIFAMLLTHKSFKRFVKKDIVDSHKSTEVIVSLSVESREKTDQIVDKALVIGGLPANPTIDYGWMYNRSFYDLDGHFWEVGHMDKNKIPTNLNQAPPGVE